MTSLSYRIRQAAEPEFSGVVRLDQEDGKTETIAFGLADRRYKLPNKTTTQFSIASATKGFTALVVMSLVETGQLDLSTEARTLLGPDLPLIDDSVTVQHLLGHRSGIGDYLDESAGGAINDYVMPIPVHQLNDTESYLKVLAGHTQVSHPGRTFAYNNGGYVVLALLAERAYGQSFDDLIQERVCLPAGLSNTRFMRSDELGAEVANGYLESDSLRTNVGHLPVLGSGDGGLFSTAVDISSLWKAMFAGQIVAAETIGLMTAYSSNSQPDKKSYGFGFWLDPTGPTVSLEGYDAGVSFVSSHNPVSKYTMTVISNTSSGAWPVARALAENAKD